MMPILPENYQLFEPCYIEFSPNGNFKALIEKNKTKVLYVIAGKNLAKKKGVLNISSALV